MDFKICDDSNPKKEAREFLTKKGMQVVLMCQNCCDNPIYSKVPYRKIDPEEMLERILAV